MATHRKNFYRLLELSPEVQDETRIRERIDEKSKEWAIARSQGSPKAQREAQKALDLIQEMKTVFADPKQRRTEAEAARAEEKEERRRKAEALSEAIEMLRNAGGCDAKQLDRLTRRFDGHFSRAEIEKRLRAAGVPVEREEADEERSRSKPRERIETVTAKKIAQNLEVLHLEDLYAFLDLRSTSSPKALRDRAEEIYRAAQRSGRTDADASARSALAGLAKTVFRDEEGKDRYDAYLAVRVLEDLDELLELAGTDGFLAAEEIDGFVEGARKRGVPAAEARDYVEQYARRRKWGLQKAGRLPAEDLRRCGLCGGLSPAGGDRCVECGEALEIECPRCGQKSPTAHRACGNCGCHFGDARLVRELLHRGGEAASEGRFPDALRAFEKALVYWPDWEPALRAKREAEERRAERERELERIETLVREAKLVAATSALEQLARRSGRTGLEGLWRRVERGKKEADHLLERGETLLAAGRTEDAVEKLAAALERCADHERARRALGSVPPPAPTALRVTATAGGFRLSWTGAGRKVSYRIRRKQGGAPNGVEDGEPVGEVRASRVDDPSPTVGVPWYYAVFAVRGGVSSSDGAVSGPHLRTAEVGDLEAVAGDGRVALFWDPPPGCLRVEVWRRKGGPPSRPGDGVGLPASGGQALDTGLENGVALGYLVVAVFAGNGAGEVRTAGRSVEVTPAAPPPAVEDLRAERQGDHVALRWTPVAGAAVQILRLEEAPDVRAGDVLAPSALAGLGRPVPGATRGRARCEGSHQGRIWFVPVSMAGDLAVAGRPALITLLDPVRGLEARRAGRSILLTWTWPAGVNEAVVSWGYDRAPETPDADRGRSARVTRREYDRRSGWVLRNPEKRAHHFAVFAKGGEDLHAPPAQAVVGMGREVTVRYEVAVQRSLLGRKVQDAWLEVTAADGCSGLGPLVLVAKERSVPLSPRDGDVFAELPSLQLDGGKAQVPIPSRWWGKRTFIKLFFKNASEAQAVRLLPASQDRLRVA